jgi:hypothetical protein
VSPTTLNPTDQALTVRLRRAGIVYPLITLQEARAAELDLPVLCAVLEQETGGGQNIFGHDPTIFTGAGQVTKEKYLDYKRQRGPSGHGGMQGVGPMQLTWYAFQDMADTFGGCWQPRFNIRVGAQHLAQEIGHGGLHVALRNYNGSDAYAVQVQNRLAKWQAVAAG